MIKSLREKFLFAVVALIFIVSLFSIQQSLAYDPTVGWTAQATGCSPVTGNVNAPLNNVYLGPTSTVPQSISTQDSSAQAGFLPAWKADMIGMSLGQFKSFIIPASEGYPPSTSNPVGGKDLFFEVTIVKIIIGPNPTTANSVVNVVYSLYTDCHVSDSNPVSGSFTGTISSDTSTKAGPPNYTGIIVGGGLVGLVILSAVGFILTKGRKPNLNTDKIINKTNAKQTQSIKSLKDSLSADTVSKTNQSSKKAPPSRRRR